MNINTKKWRLNSPALKNSTSSAVAVNYSKDEMNAPQVSVKGSNKIADEMKVIAKRYGVPIHRSNKLANKLSEIDVSSEIPRDLYEDMSRVFLSIETTRNKIKD